MGAQDGRRGAIEIVLTQRLIEFQQLRMPVAPLRNIMLANLCVVLEQAGVHLLPSLTPDQSEAERESELPIAGIEIDFAREGDIAIVGAVVFPLHLEML